jgi:hypothetical protein
VLEVEVDKLPGRRVSGKLWLWSSSLVVEGVEHDVSTLVRAYFHRFDSEHTFRFFKQTLGLSRFKCQQPSTFDTWFQLIIAGFNQLLLARSWVQDHRLPWEKEREILSPGRVRRVIKKALAESWFPPERRFIPRAGPGARLGTFQGARTKHPAILKG